MLGVLEGMDNSNLLIAFLQAGAQNALYRFLKPFFAFVWNQLLHRFVGLQGLP